MEQEQKDITLYERASEAAKYILSQTDLKPEVAFILGSGLGDYADSFSDAVYIPFDKIPHFKKSTVKGHKGNVVIGNKEGKTLLAMQGRYHFYEGHHIRDVVFPVYVMKVLNIKSIMITNASGGINKMLNAGDLMIINDHINYMGVHPLIGPNDERFGGERFPDMSNCYNKELRDIIVTTMEKEGIAVKQGVYIGFSGPSYETAAEIRMAGLMGADAVGMSTVPEAIVANGLKIKVGGISCVCNMATGIHKVPLTHKEVVEVANAVKEKFKKLLDSLIHQL